MLRFVVFACFLAITVASEGVTEAGKTENGEENALKIEDVPYQLSFLIDYEPVCGASILSARYVLTAAHCTQMVNHRALTCSVRAGSADKYSGGTVYPAWEITPHPLYDPKRNRFDYDISVVKVTRSIEFGATAQPIKLPSVGQTYDLGTIVRVSGWDNDDVNGPGKNHSRWLQEVTASVVDRNTCRYIYRSYTDRMLCVDAAGKASCHGDFGGPVVDQTRFVQIGVVNGGRMCNGTPGMYTNLSNSQIRSFIKKCTGL